MAREDEVFEVLCAALRSARVHGTEFAQARLQELAGHTSGECFAAKTPEVVGQVNRPSLKLRAAKRIFQIAYDKGAGTRRAELLRQLGYGVISVIGNEAAKVLLTSTKPYDLFIVGHAAPEQTRREMVAPSEIGHHAWPERKAEAPEISSSTREWGGAGGPSMCFNGKRKC